MKKFLSYSEYNSYMNYHDSYIDTYILGKDIERKPEEQLKIDLGTAIHKWMADEKYPIMKQCRELGLKNKEIVKMRKLLDKAENKRADEPEVSINAKLGDISLGGFFDGISDGYLIEYKTSDEDKWFKNRVELDDQLSFYALMYSLTYHQYFKGINLYAMNTTKATCKTFKTARGPRDLAYIKGRIIECVKSMKKENLWDKRLSRAERDAINQKTLL